ncbi:MAG: hypothetical protein GXP23_01490 [Gammaproteobacteria bacterium]|nr:hypothetical protein [Gammaproteobacteria bacterium]
MDHTHIVKASDLESYADTRESQGVIPELVYLLVRQSVSELTICRIPYGDAINQPGMDGLVETSESFREYVTEGASYWEIGTNREPQKKATSDFRKRTDAMDSDEKEESTFVFVTPRSAGSGGWDETRQSKWLKKRKDEGWRLIRIIDGVKLADWLREFPAIGRWMAEKIGMATGLSGFITPAEHWELIQSQDITTDPPLPDKLFVIGRDNACSAIQKLFEGRLQRMLFSAESEGDVEDFISAYLSSLEGASDLYGNRCIFIREEDAWRSVVETKKPHILVAHPKLGLDSENSDLQMLATRNGHAVIIPICGAWTGGDSHEIIKLRSPSESQIQAILEEAGFTTVRARELASAGANRLSALRRFLQGLGSLPPYATWGNARELAQAGLLGKWDGNNKVDLEVIGEFLGKVYGEWAETIRPALLLADTPLFQKNEKWRVVARGEAWNALGPRITDVDLDSFKKMALRVLGEREPSFELPKDERYAAGIYGKVLEYSGRIREGIAETLALLGSRPRSLTSCSQGKAEAVAVLTVRELLQNAQWDRWASLDGLLPLLAEAAPDEFLDMVEASLENIDESPFHHVFAQEGSGGIGGTIYTSGLLWALESLAWHPDYLPRVILVLGDLAFIDPGGSWSNRPANSLTDILLPWHVQTCASIEKRQSSVKALLNEQPEVAWKLLVSLLPHSHGVTSGCHRPSWRDLIPRDCKEVVTNKEYFDQVTMYSEMAVTLAKDDINKINELIGHLSDLPMKAHASIVEHLKSDQVLSLPEIDRTGLWEKLTALVRKHRKFSDANWTMSENMIVNIELVGDLLKPESPERIYRHLFTFNDSDLYDEKGDYKEQARRLESDRQDALAVILEMGGIQAVLDFNHLVSNPYRLGLALGHITGDTQENELLPASLDREDAALWSMIGGYIFARYSKLGLTWVDQLLSCEWSKTEQSMFLTLLPFVEDVWQKAAQVLVDDEELYWRSVVVNPWEADDVTVAVEKLIKYGRADAAVKCMSKSFSGKDRYNTDLATRTLLAMLELEEMGSDFDQHATIEVITQVQHSPDRDEDALFTIEWNFLPLLNRFSQGSPITLEKRLAEDASFFCEVISLVFRSKNDKDERSESTEQQKNQARLAYQLLSEWKIVPGVESDGSIDEGSFNTWMSEAKKISQKTGHYEIAMSQIGQMLMYAPNEPEGLWIHPTMANVLNEKGMSAMRDGFTTELFNSRGVHSPTGGKEELKLAKINRDKADELDARGYTRFATAMRELAQRYQREAEYEADRDPYER